MAPPTAPAPLQRWRLLALLALAVGASAKTVYYDLTVTYGLAAPDCVNKQVLFINGDYPGPTLTGVEGDTMVVTLRDHLGTEGLAMHWHGIKQIDSNLQDGTAFVTQCPITPLDFLNYTFVLDKAGTYMYHGHLDDQVGAGLYGKLFVYEAPKKGLPYRYDAERSLILNDWWHRDVYQQVAGLDHVPFIWVGEPQSLLINGRGEYNCTLVPEVANPLSGDAKVCNATDPDCGPDVIEVEQGKTYRFRLASVTGLASLNFAVEGHKLTVIEADGYSVKPFVVGKEGLDIYSGQTTDFLLKADQPVGNYWIRTAVIGRLPKTTFGKAILRYKGAKAVRPKTDPPPVRVWNDTAAALLQVERFKGLMQGKDKYGQVPPVPLFKGEKAGTPGIPKTKESPLVLVNAQQKVEGRVRWAMNNISLELPPVPYALGINTSQAYLYSPSPSDTPFSPWNYSAPPPTDAKYGSGYYSFTFGATIDIVLQNANTLTPGNSEYHPWHMHGHQFWVLGYGFGTFDPKRDHKNLNLVDPPYRNTVTVLPYGWVVLRFKADNPGVWLFHCHIAPHLHMGMGIVFVDGHTLPVPEKIQRCGIFY